MPGLHAILIGVSEYDVPRPDAPPRPFLATSLDGPARTVAALEAWLRSHSAELSVPVKTLRVLASPSAQERAMGGTLANCQPATCNLVVEALRAWCIDASKDPEDVALFYFSGHGIQRSRTDTVMLLQDFNQSFTLLGNSISLDNIYGGMGSTRGLPALARTQWFFADCCRSAVEALRGYELAATAEVFSPEANLADDRQAPIFLAANSGRESFTLEGQCTTFGADLLTCLNGAGADQKRVNGQPPSWVVTAYSLADSMARLAGEYNARIGQVIAEYNRANPGRPITRDYRRTPVPILVSDPVLRTLSKPPIVPCSFRPEPATMASLLDLHFGPFASGPSTYIPPFETLQGFQQQAGFYSFGATIADPSADGGKRPIPAQPVWVGPPFCILDLPT